MTRDNDEPDQPNWRGRTRTGRKKPVYKAENPLDAVRKAALRKAGYEYATRRNNAKSVKARREAWEDYCEARDRANGEYKYQMAAKALRDARQKHRIAKDSVVPASSTENVG
jgi:hypothetical protein